MFTGQQAVLKQQNPTPRENVRRQPPRVQGISGQELNGNELNAEFHRSTHKKKKKTWWNLVPVTPRLTSQTPRLLVVPGSYSSRPQRFQGQPHDAALDPTELWPKTLDRDEERKVGKGNLQKPVGSRAAGKPSDDHRRRWQIDFTLLR